MLTILWDMKGPLRIDFLEKGATINTVSYCEPPRKILPYLLNEPRNWKLLSEDTAKYPP